MEGDGDVDFATFQKWWHVHESQKWASTMQFFVLFLMYPGLSKMTFDAFSCRAPLVAAAQVVLFASRVLLPINRAAPSVSFGVQSDRSRKRCRADSAANDD